MSRFLIMAGGTGGHVIPALAVAKELRTKGHKVSWIGTAEGIEHRLVPAANIQIDYIDIKGFRRTGLRRQLIMPFMLVKALWQSIRIIRKRGVDVVIGFGGFAAGPGGIAALLLRKPLVLHEQNSIAGVTNKYLANFARKVITGFAQVEGLGQYEWLGNPVRADIAALGYQKEVARVDESEIVNVLIVGGSRGARAFNNQLPDVLSRLEGVNISIWHQTGQADEQKVREAYASNTNMQVKVSAFIEDMAKAYDWAHIVICRAGAMTVTEICAAGMAAVFIPYPYAVSDHQRKNAQVMVDNGAAFMLHESELSETASIKTLKQLITDKEVRMRMSRAALAQAKPDATADVAARCLEVVHA